jgi:hypothetical protein
MLPSSATGTKIASLKAMADRTLAQRVAALERQMEGKTLQQHFREHAELVERLLIYRLEESEKRQDAKWDARLDIKLAALEERQDAKWDTKLAAREQRQDTKWDTRFVALENLAKEILRRLS